MDDLIGYLIKLAGSLGAIFGGGWLAIAGMDYQSYVLFWGGLIIALLGILYLAWQTLKSGVSFWGD